MIDMGNWMIGEKNISRRFSELNSMVCTVLDRTNTGFAGSNLVRCISVCVRFSVSPCNIEDLWWSDLSSKDFYVISWQKVKQIHSYLKE